MSISYYRASSSKFKTVSWAAMALLFSTTYHTLSWGIFLGHSHCDARLHRHLGQILMRPSLLAVPCCARWSIFKRRESSTLSTLVVDDATERCELGLFLETSRQPIRARHLEQAGKGAIAHATAVAAEVRFRKCYPRAVMHRRR